jgi:Arc/MetJ-type ribon-helix-helix transcriptional regulator
VCLVGFEKDLNISLYYNRNTMSMKLVQARLPKGVVEEMEKMVESGQYGSKSDVIRASLRRLIAMNAVRKMIGSIPNTGDSVKEVREIRKKLSKEYLDLDEINSL